jgi:hypothetical protein
VSWIGSDSAAWKLIDHPDSNQAGSFFGELSNPSLVLDKSNDARIRKSSNPVVTRAADSYARTEIISVICPVSFVGNGTGN